MCMSVSQQAAEFGDLPGLGDDRDHDFVMHLDDV